MTRKEDMTPEEVQHVLSQVLGERVRYYYWQGFAVGTVAGLTVALLVLVVMGAW